MFGLMHKNACGTQEAAREQYRLHYCGTCKAIGKQYGQSARMFLNYDCVFLAELLTALSAEDTAAWHDSYHAYNCFATGGDGVAMPFPLRYAATANVLLSALKTDDNLKDSPAFHWRVLKRWFNADFKTAEREMIHFGVDMDEIWRWITCQQQREREKLIPGEATAAFTYFAEPTARITAAIFSKGAALIGTEQEAMQRFGYQLGELIYIMDALEDEVQDKKKHNFNAIQRIFQTVNAETKQSVADYIHFLTQQIKESIQALPLADLEKAEYRQRFSTNVTVRVSNALEEQKPYFETVGKNLLSRLGLRARNAKSFAQRVTQDKPSWIAKPQYAFAYMAVMLAPQLPQEINTATEHSAYAVPAFATVMTGCFSALFFRHRIKRFKSMYKKGLKRLKEKWRNDPKKKSSSEKAALTILMILGILLLILCCVACIGCKSCFDDCDSNSNSNNCGDACCNCCVDACND